jgi:uncharacterized protein (DUF111 family)
MLSGSGISVVAEDIPAELVTPTGFGILKTLSERCGKLPDMLVDRVGYGFGKTETGRLNALRVILGTAGEARETAADAAELNPEGIAGRGTAIVRDRVALLETNLDNTSGEALGYAMERLMKAGALDVYFTPIQMKKNRPATMLCVLCETADAERLSEIIFGETETLGVRIREQERITLKREIKTVQTRLGEVRVKSVAVRGLVRARPEYEDCVKIAREHKLSFHEVYEAIKKELQSEW